MEKVTTSARQDLSRRKAVDYYGIDITIEEVEEGSGRRGERGEDRR
jgi:hypothetical protein